MPERRSRDHQSPGCNGGIKKPKKPALGEAGFLNHVFLRERRYADHGHLLPRANVGQAVEPGVAALPLG